MPSHTITGLKRWSCKNKDLPSIDQIKAIHVYDFDNTLFQSPLPNPQLWNGQTVGFLQQKECFANGGWWHDPNLLAATGEGLDKEEQKGWKGWWNEEIVQLVRLSMQQKDALTVLLTGRNEGGFADLIKRIVNSRNLDFDLVGLKPEVGPNNQRFSNTMAFKQAFLDDLIFTYRQAEEVRIYEDRIRHVKGFRDYLNKMNDYLRSVSSNPSPPRKEFFGEVIHVAEASTTLDPVVETAEIQRMINSHNLAIKNTQGRNKSPYGKMKIKRTVAYTGYLISAADSERLMSNLVLPIIPPGGPDYNEVKFMSNSVLITPRPATETILEKVGGVGKKITWQVTSTGCFDNRLWAARVEPIPKTESYYTENPYPLIVLALRKGTRPIDAIKIHHWLNVPPEKSFVFESVVGERATLRVEEESPGESEYDSLFVNRNNKREYHQANQRDHSHNNSAHYQNRHDGGGYQGGRNFSNNHYNEDSPRSRGGSNQRGRGGRGGRGGNYHQNDQQRSGGHGGRGGRGNFNSSSGSRGGRHRGRGGGGGGGPSGGGNPGYKSLDDYGAEGSYDGGGGGGGGPPVMNY